MLIDNFLIMPMNMIFRFNIQYSLENFLNVLGFRKQLPFGARPNVFNRKNVIYYFVRLCVLFCRECDAVVDIAIHRHTSKCRPSFLAMQQIYILRLYVWQLIYQSHLNDSLTLSKIKSLKLMLSIMRIARIFGQH